MNTEQAAPSRTVQTGWVVERTNDGLPLYFSPQVGRDAGAGAANGWAAEADKALRFARAQDAKEFAETYLPVHAPHCRPAEKTFGLIDG